MSDNLLKISLKQGKQFKKYQSKIKKAISRKTTLLEGFSTDETILRSQEDGYVPVLQNSQISSSMTQNINQKDLDELNRLQQKYDDLFQQYIQIQKNMGNKGLARISRQSSSNPYLNKTIKFSTGHICYVTNDGVVKYIPSTEIWNSTTAPKYPTDINIPWNETYNAPGTVIPTTPQLISGTPVKMNESLGNEGKNVYASTLISNPVSSYIGCYNDKPAPISTLVVPIMGSSNQVNGFVASASSVYQENNDFTGPWCAFDNNVNTWWHSYEGAPHDYDVNTGQYKGLFGVPNIINSSGQPQTIMGEYLQINFPNLNPITVTKYDIQGRQGCCGDPNGRDPNTWYILGWKDNQWYQVDYQSNVSFNWQMKTFNITNPQAYGAYIILVTVVGDANAPPGNRGSVQIATWNLYTSSDYSFTDDQRAMIWNPSTIGYTTFEKCQQYATENAYQYFGMQDYRQDGTAACLLSNDITRTESYGNATEQDVLVPIWASNTNTGSYASLTSEGRLVVYDANGNEVFSSTNAPAQCSNYYSSLPDTDNPGYDIGSYQNMSKDDCKKLCDGNENCLGYLVGNTAWTNYCWIKNVSDPSNFKPYSGIDYYIKNPTPQNKQNCKFILILERNGQVGIYRGNDVSQIGENIWKMDTYGKQKNPNNSLISALGKTGTNYMTSGTTLMQGEWIGSEDGTLQLLMQSDGNLVLYTSEPKQGCVKGSGDKFYGTGWINAVYKVDAVGDKNALGKIGYVDSDSNLKEYPPSMLGYSNDYQLINGYDSGGNDITTYGVSTINDCQNACSNFANCAGFVFQQSTNSCWIKDSNMYPKGEKQLNDTLVLGLRKPALPNSTSCSNEIVNVDTITYNNYTKGDQMTPETECNPPMISQADKLDYDNIKSQLAILGNDIANKMDELYAEDNRIYKKMNMNSEEFKKNLLMYRNVNLKIKKQLELESNNSIEGMQNLNMNDLNGMLSDTDIRVLQENYSYIFWSILAVGLLTATVVTMKK